MLDIPCLKGVGALPASYEVNVEDLEAPIRVRNVNVTLGTAILVRAGTACCWGANGTDYAKIAQHGSAVVGMRAAKYLVGRKGALMLGSDTSGLEYVPPRPEDNQTIGGRRNPVHVYLVVEQGVHILELFNQQQLTDGKIHEFAYVDAANQIRGTVTGTAMRPVATR